MSNLKQHPKSLEVRFQTLVAPPPYSHQYLLQLDFSSDEPIVSFQIHYTDRDQLTEEEILEEGFGPDDDFEWKGALPKVWKVSTLDFIYQTKIRAQPPHADSPNLLELLIDYGQNEQVKGMPDSTEDWEYFVQQIIQAVYELSQKAPPLEISYVEQEKGSKQSIQIQAQFSHRSLQLVSEKAGKKEKVDLPWSQLMPLLQTIYLPDYDPEKAHQHLPDKAGKYISQGDGLWYTLGKAITNPSKKVDAVGKLERELKQLCAW